MSRCAYCRSAFSVRVYGVGHVIMRLPLSVAVHLRNSAYIAALTRRGAAEDAEMPSSIYVTIGGLTVCSLQCARLLRQTTAYSVHTALWEEEKRGLLCAVHE